MPKPSPVEYERMVASVFKRMHDQKFVDTLELKHNVLLTGKAGHKPHQIDVYWRFKMAGIEYSAVVEVKAGKRRVQRSVAMQFESLLRDLPGQPRGLIVSQNGYQSGAIEFARGHRIELYTLTDRPVPATRISTLGWAHLTVDPAVRDGRLSVRAEIFDPEVRKISIKLDPEGLTREMRAQIEAREFDRSLQQNLYDAQGHKISTLDGLIRKYVKSGTAVGTYTFVNDFHDPTFFCPFVGEPLKARVQKITIEIALTSRVESSFSQDKLAELVLTNIHDGTVQIFRKLP